MPQRSPRPLHSVHPQSAAWRESGGGHGRHRPGAEIRRARLVRRRRGPLIASLRRILVEAGLESYLSRQEERLKQKQFEAMQGLVTTHLLQPVGALFVSEVQADEIAAARRDFACVQAAALQVA